MADRRRISVTINGDTYEREVETRLLLSDFIRHECELTGTHVGCEHGVCGACTILLDGITARSCLMLAVQADGHELLTIEGIAPNEEELHPLQQAFMDNHGLQCGYCTPGMLTTLLEFLRDNPDPTEKEVTDRHFRQSLPLHRLPGHRRCRARRGRPSEGRGQGLEPWVRRRWAPGSGAWRTRRC